MKKKYIKGPKEGILPEQIQDINKMFYRDFSLGYFENKIVSLLEIITDNNKYTKSLENRSFKIGKLEIKNIEEVNAEEMLKYAKSEIVSTYYHCLETFMRLFIAHAKHSESPLMELTTLNIEEYHNMIKEFSRGNIKIVNKSLTEEEIILSVLIGSKDLETSPLSKTEIERLKEWIVWCANELKHISEYNSFKHGLSMLIGYGAIEIKNPERPFYKKGEAVHILESKYIDGRFKFSLNNIFTEYHFKVILIHFFSQLIENMMKIGEMRYVTHISEQLFKPYLCAFNYFELRDNFRQKENTGDLMSSYAMELGYIDAIQMDELAKYIGLEKAPQTWKIAFEKIKFNIPSKIKWLDKEHAKSILEYYNLKEETFKNKYLETIDMINANIYLKVLSYLWHYILYIDSTGLYKDVWNWKETNKLFENVGNHMLPVVVLLSGNEIHNRNMKSRKFDKEQIEEQIRNINQCCTMDKKRFGINGIRLSQMVWGSYFMKGKIIQVGRLQYEFDEEVPTNIKNYKDGDYIYIHIPKGDNLDIKDVEESIYQSKDKIKKFFPEIDISRLQYYTNTWLLSNELNIFLDENSNIIKFKNKFDIIEQTENIEDFLNFVFQEKDCNINYENLKEETTLQKKLKKYILEDKKLHIGLGILKN